MALLTYCPEMNQPKPVAQIEAQSGHYGNHYFVWTPLQLKGRGCRLLRTEQDSTHRRYLWKEYVVTNLFFKKLCQMYDVSCAVLLD